MAISSKQMLSGVLALMVAGLISGCADMQSGLNTAVSKANGAYNSALSSVTGGKAGAGVSSGPIYTPISGGDHLKGLFAGDDREKASKGHLSWPRVALTYQKWGPNLDCWEVKATIWANARSSHDEVFSVCSDTPILVKNMTGDVGSLQEAPMIRALQKSIAMGVPNTGDRHTNGPTPPRHPFQVEAGNHADLSANRLMIRLDQINVRIAFTAGYVVESQASINSVMDDFRDWRMWTAAFDPSGRVGD